MKLHSFLASLLVTATVAIAAEIPKVTPAEAARLVADGKAVLVDVREPNEWAETGVAAPAVLLAKSDFDGAQKEWKPFLEKNAGKEIILYCRTGHRAGIIGAALAEKGVNAANAGGLKDWTDAGLPVRKVEDQLFEHIYGGVAGAFIGNAMGAPVEGWTWEKIEKTYGFLDKFIADPRGKGVPNQPGWTEDGMERYKLLCRAILKKGSRINIEDLAQEWAESIDPTRIGFRIGAQDRVIYDLIKAGLPPQEVGRYALWPGFMGTSKMMQPLGLISACRPDVAAKDALDIGRVKDSSGRPLWRVDKVNEDGRYKSTLIYNAALENCAAIAAATAEAMRPNATVDSVIAVALAQLPPGARKDVETTLGFADAAKDWKDFRAPYQKYWDGTPISNAIDILAGGLACFKLAKGQPREAVLYATNLGRDTDCKAYVAGGLAGTLRGIKAWPPEWVQLVESAVATDPYTVDKKTARQIAEGLYKVALSELQKTKSQTAEVESLLAK